ncbi:hypothetical protein LIER_36701 [Lithospermum erythrorhizon]|uniref:Uncharacterized protein n=1 Tax=Lithospermum erythrorhizon TaxID=34254 RepID=A0AAV3P9D1_LITER
MSKSRSNWYLRPAGDNDFETDSETEVVSVRGPVLMLEYVHDQGAGDVGGVVAPSRDVDGVMGPGHQEGEADSDLDSVPELDDKGNLRRLEIDGDILYGKEIDNFDNDELEQEIVVERQRLQEEADMQDLGDMDMPDESQNNEGAPSTPWHTRANERKKIVESSGDSAGDDDILNDHEGESDLGSMSGSSDDDTPKEKTVRFNEFDMQNPNLKVGLVFTIKNRPKEL